MAKATYAYELFSMHEREKFITLAKNLNETQTKYDREDIYEAFTHWQSYAAHLKKIQQEEEQKRKVIEILKTSTRGHRSTMEKEILRRYISANLTCIPKSISMSEMDQLCNELDWYPYIGRSILFLQGDFGNVYYMIAAGRVGLYLEPSKDREMTIAREFGQLRGQPFRGSDEDLQRLGNNIFNLSAGAGFGEYAILATTNKIRSCAVVALDPESILLIMHAETYNAVLRQHHYRQKQLSSATGLLTELPLFKHHNYSKIASIAYTMRSQTYSNQSIIVKYGDIINNIMLVASGQVKVYAPPSNNTSDNNGSFHLPATNNSPNNPNNPSNNNNNHTNPFIKILEKRIPKLAVALYGRGQIIGEMEMQTGARTFQMTYEASGSSTEILEIPATVFKENVHNEEFKSSVLYKHIEGMNELKEQTRVHRVSRAYDAMKRMMEGNTVEDQTKEEILAVLPNIVDSENSGHYPPRRRTSMGLSSTSGSIKFNPSSSNSGNSGNNNSNSSNTSTAIPAFIATMMTNSNNNSNNNSNSYRSSIYNNNSTSSGSPTKVNAISMATSTTFSTTNTTHNTNMNMNGSFVARPPSQLTNITIPNNNVPSASSASIASTNRKPSTTLPSTGSPSPRKLSFMPVPAMASK